jgi:ribosomal protein L32
MKQNETAEVIMGDTVKCGKCGSTKVSGTVCVGCGDEG